MSETRPARKKSPPGFTTLEEEEEKFRAHCVSAPKPPAHTLLFARQELKELPEGCWEKVFRHLSHWPLDRQLDLLRATGYVSPLAVESFAEFLQHPHAEWRVMTELLTFDLNNN